MTARAVVASSMSEKDLERVVVDAAREFSWFRYHTHRSTRSEPGWPDEVLIRGTELIFAELKRQSEKPTPAQEDVLARLRNIKAVEVFVWRPSDIDQIIERLGRPKR